MIPPPPPIDIVMSCIYIYYVLPGLLNSKTQSLACSTMTKTKQDCPRKEIFVTYTKIITLFSLHFAPFPFISCARLCLPLSLPDSSSDTIKRFSYIILHFCSISCPTPPLQRAIRSPPPPSPHTRVATSVLQKRPRRRGQPLCCTRPTT